MAVIDLTTRRLERLEKAQLQTNETLARIADILEAHSHHFERLEEAILGVSERVDSLSEQMNRMGERVDRMGERLDRLTTAIARGRTQDLVRFDKLEKRVHNLEKAKRRRTTKS